MAVSKSHDGLASKSTHSALPGREFFLFGVTGVSAKNRY